MSGSFLDDEDLKRALETLRCPAPEADVFASPSCCHFKPPLLTFVLLKLLGWYVVVEDEKVRSAYFALSAAVFQQLRPRVEELEAYRAASLPDFGTDPAAIGMDLNAVGH